MLFTQPVFLFLFLPLLLGLYFLPWKAHRNALLLAASLIFYVSGGGWFVVLMAASIVFNYLMAIRIDRARESGLAMPLLTIAVGVNLIVLAIFKYADFIVGNLNALLTLAGLQRLPEPHILLPIGISFFSFHAISYVVDVYRRDADAQKNPGHAALYLLLFPQLIAGPIIRYRDIADQLAARTVRREGFALGVRRFIVGLSKKMLVANAVAVPADKIFALPIEQVGPGLSWLAIVCYSVQIYFDFSGYSDMAIGLGAMFGFRFPENFNYPYVAQSIQEFWRRWHISLSSWFRDYLYRPLGGNRVSAARVYVNLVTVFFLCGLWHGASWSFVVWGLFHGSFLVIERLGLAAWMAGSWRGARHVYVLLVVMVSWVFFRADTLSYALGFLQAMAGRAAAATAPYTPATFLDRSLVIGLVAGGLGSMPLVPAVKAWRDRLVEAGEESTLAWTAGLVETVSLSMLLLLALMFVGAGAYNPFIYFRF